MVDQAAKLRELVSDENAKNKENAFAWDDNKSAKVIAVTSGKGGVGKTNVTVNLALALKEEGQRVLVIDADLGMANVDVILGSLSKYHLLQLLEPDITLKDVLINGPYEINYISGGSGIEKAKDFTPEEREILLNKLAECNEIADVILVDTGAGLGPNVINFILAADEVLLITTPEPTAITDAYAVMKAYSTRAANKNLKVIVNRVYDENESKDVITKLNQTSTKFLKMPITSAGYVFEDRRVSEAVRKQKPFIATEPDSLAAKCVKAIAKNLLYGEEMKVKQGWKGFLKQIFNFSRK